MVATYDEPGGPEIVVEVLSALDARTAMEGFLCGAANEKLGRVDDALDAYDAARRTDHSEEAQLAGERLRVLVLGGQRVAALQPTWPKRVALDPEPPASSGWRIDASASQQEPELDAEDEADYERDSISDEDAERFRLRFR